MFVIPFCPGTSPNPFPLTSINGDLLFVVFDPCEKLYGPQNGFVSSQFLFLCAPLSCELLSPIALIAGIFFSGVRIFEFSHDQFPF